MSEVSTRPIGPQVPGLAAKTPEHITHTGKVVTLVPLNPSHADDLFEVVGREQNAWLWDYLPDGPFMDVQSFRDHIERKSKSPDPLFFAIIDNSTGKPIGSVSLMRIDVPNRVIEVGHVTFSPLLQQKPGATETIYLLARHVFEDLGYRRYEWKCDSLNAPSRRAAQRFGFTFDGVFRQHMIRKGRNWDTAWFSMLDGEWPLCRRAFERWLAPDNFDAEGRQKLPLASFRQSGQAQNS